MATFAFYEQATGRIVSIVQTSVQPSPPSADFAYAPCEPDIEPAGLYVVGGKIAPKPTDVLATENLAAAWATLRRRRDALLAQSDWTQVPDAPVDKVAWAEYRQALRNLPQTTADPTNVDWPVAP
jgi:hypothetical protein